MGFNTETVQQREDQFEHDKLSPMGSNLMLPENKFNRIRQSFVSATDFKATALDQAAEAKRALQVNSAKVNELSKEIWGYERCDSSAQACSHSESARVR